MDERVRTSLRGRSVMVVEDEFFQAEELSRALSGAGARLVGPFPTVESALAGLGEGAGIDAAVLDVNLRGVAVAPLVEALSARGIPFLFATGYDRATLPAAWGEAPVFEKPLNLGRLVEALGALPARADGVRPATRAPGA